MRSIVNDAPFTVPVHEVNQAQLESRRTIRPLHAKDLSIMHDNESPDTTSMALKVSQQFLGRVVRRVVEQHVSLVDNDAVQWLMADEYLNPELLAKLLCLPESSPVSLGVVATQRLGLTGQKCNAATVIRTQVGDVLTLCSQFSQLREMLTDICGALLVVGKSLL